ncbi:sphingomyelin phosphodiesterase-like isoform X2 [Biomphalaria glabrata]|uniref:Sphingomyelin phosphodiesterase n=1 Tax=Biomphalaria glabrata TaxID=6526 RepID=A0A9W2YIL6_BIOGL|nr:sphingomyelin phosphodiesterase-like isoform X2 [Biomphalaria glabrata]
MSYLACVFLTVLILDSCTSLAPRYGNVESPLRVQPEPGRFQTPRVFEAGSVSSQLGEEEKGGYSQKNDRQDALASYLKRHRKLGAWKNVSCDICIFVVSEIRHMTEEAASVEEIVKAVTKFCIFFKIEDEHVCTLIVPQFQEEVLYVVDNLILSPGEACGIVIGDTCSTPYFPGDMWNVTFPDKPKPEPRPPTPPKPNAPILKFLHLTDIHLDFQYAVGSPVPCGEPLCCRVDDNVTVTGQAGKYGDYYNCDAPLDMLTSLFSHLSSIQDQFDFIIMTGDIPAHDVWSQSRTEQVAHVTALDKLFTNYLPNKPVYSCVGNHETSPINAFPQPGIPGQDMTWMYGAMAESWGKWLPLSALDDVLRCGIYSVSPYPGFRIISINNNYCNTGNWWLLLNSTDPCNVLQWFVGELQKAEDSGEKVYLLMHIPPGSTDCYKYWSHNLYNIVNRYENTIVNQFYGHSHHDWIMMFYDNATFTRPLGFGFVSPSVTTYSFNNPIYRIYTMDGNYTGSSWAVLDYNNFYMNLTEANAKGNPQWIFEYNPKKDYNMTGLYANDWDDLIQRLQKNDTLFQLFYKHYSSMYQGTPCHGNCKTDILCDMVEGRSYDPDLCQQHIRP